MIASDPSMSLRLKSLAWAAVDGSGADRHHDCQSALDWGSDSFLMKFAGDCGSSTENRRHAERLSNFIASTEWFGV